jgi:hypothetical protein
MMVPDYSVGSALSRGLEAPFALMLNVALGDGQVQFSSK